MAEDSAGTALRVTIAIPDETRFEAVLRAAEAAGFRREEAFPLLGVATGTVAKNHMAVLEAVEGIGSVERERTYTTSR